MKRDNFTQASFVAVMGMQSIDPRFKIKKRRAGDLGVCFD